MTTGSSSHSVGTAPVLLADGKKFKVSAPMKVLVKTLGTNTEPVYVDTEEEGNYAFALEPGDGLALALAAGERIWARSNGTSQTVQVLTSTPPSSL